MARKLRAMRISVRRARNPLDAWPEARKSVLAQAVCIPAAALLTSHSWLAGRGSSRSHALPETNSTRGSETALEVLGSRLTNLYSATSLPLLATTCFLGWQTRPTADDKHVPVGFGQFQLRYLLVWFLAITADWLQGPYVYELYASYGWSKAEIAELFVAGFASSMVFGVFIGSVADAWGRKFCALLYCFLYAAACLTKHCNIFGVLMLGRLLGGAATSLLFSTFECWMVGEHKRCGFPDHLLRYMFGLMFFVPWALRRPLPISLRSSQGAISCSDLRRMASAVRSLFHALDTVVGITMVWRCHDAV